MTPKRRLPLIQASAEPETPPRPPWQWALFGSGILMIAWLTLEILAAPLSALIVRRSLGSWSSPEDLSAHLEDATSDVLGRMALENLLLQVAIVGLASAAAGLIVGRYGPGRGIVPSAVGGALVAVVALALASLSGATDAGSELGTLLRWGSAVLIPWASGLAALGAWRGSRTKRELTGT